MVPSSLSSNSLGGLEFGGRTRFAATHSWAVFAQQRLSARPEESPGATEKQLNSPQTRPIGLILALRCAQRVRLVHRIPPSVRNLVVALVTHRPRSSREGTFLDFHQTAFDDR